MYIIKALYIFNFINMNLGKIKTGSKKAFTLIELLVVITIIGILATWAVSVYTSQIQKARDTTRINDTEALKWWIEQFYQDNSQYPSTDATSTNWLYFTWVITYTPKLPKDPKSGEICNKWANANATACDYMYAVTTDSNGILFWEYKVSTGFENSWNINVKAAKDWGTEQNRYEVWLDLADAKSTVCDRTAKMSVAQWVSAISTSNCTAAITNTNWNWTLMISWN